MKKTKQIKVRNFVVKNMKNMNYGSGVHKEKTGPKASRARQKQNLIRGKE